MENPHLTEIFETYRQNVLPAMLKDFAGSLGLKTVDPYLKLGIGFSPSDGAWVLPERDLCGELVGLCRRYNSGKKYAVTGSKRGFTYAVNPAFFSGQRRYNTASYHFENMQKLGMKCPICGKPDWCMISSDHAVIRCNRKRSDIPHGSGWLHVQDEETYHAYGTGQLLYESDLPVLIVEGASDWATATELGFVAIGKPAANTSQDASLKDILKDRAVIIVGDNDPNEVGKRGVERTFSLLENLRHVTKVFPPPDIKDLREWYTKGGLTAKDFMDYVESRGVKNSDAMLLPSGNPSDIAESWLDRVHSHSDIVTLRIHGEDWYEFRDGIYQQVEKRDLRGQLYNFLRGRYYINFDRKGNPTEVKVCPTRSRVDDILDALNEWCPVFGEVPTWLRWGGKPDPSNLIAFKNGVLDARRYVEGYDDYFMPSTPEFFTLTAIPHVYDPNDTPDEEIMEFFRDVLGNDDRIDLLQEWCGYVMIPSQRFEAIMMFLGPRRAGKGTTMDIITSMLGSNQVASTSFSSLCGEFGYSNLVGKLVALMPDAKVPRTMDSAAAVEKLNQISGGDGVSVNRKFRDSTSRTKLSCRFIISVNDIPDLPDNSRALESRMQIIRYDKSYAGKEDRQLKARLPLKAHTLIPWALDGLKRLHENGKFTIPKTSAAAYADLQKIATPIGEFIDECCTSDKKSFIEKDKLYVCWCNWSQKEGLPRISQGHFRQKLLALHFEGVHSGNMIIGGEKAIGYYGLKLTETAIHRYLGVV